MEKTFRLCMFDMGGVVVKHSEISLERILLRNFGITEYDSFSSLDPRLPDLLAEHSKAAIDEEQMWQQFSQMTGIVVPTHNDSLWGRYFKPELETYVVAIIEELKEKGYRVVCATNTEEAHFAYHRKAGHYDMFDAIYASLQLHEVKPERAFFDKILELEEVKPEEVLFVDDLLENCEAAANLGLNTVIYADPVELRWQLASMEIL
ncbi:MAG TPA: hypothetical protein DCG32_07190 [Sphaerochaeta sp.]|jgi:putative hydrolase of the HAD superfamily|nr:hypothetical protein [Sphaerochaeta sp.]